MVFTFERTEKNKMSSCLASVPEEPILSINSADYSTCVIFNNCSPKARCILVRLGFYSPIFTKPEVNNWGSIIYLSVGESGGYNFYSLPALL